MAAAHAIKPARPNKQATLPELLALLVPVNAAAERLIGSSNKVSNLLVVLRDARDAQGGDLDRFAVLSCLETALGIADQLEGQFAHYQDAVRALGADKTEDGEHFIRNARHLKSTLTVAVALAAECVASDRARGLHESIVVACTLAMYLYEDSFELRITEGTTSGLFRSAVQ